MAETDELYGVLCAHAARYPLMRPTDAVKLIYQGEFGSGHMKKTRPPRLIGSGPNTPRLFMTRQCRCMNT